MDICLFIIISIVFILLLIKIIRKKIYDYMSEINNLGKLTNENNYYNNYFKISEKKHDRKMINNVAFLREGIISNIYDIDVKILEFKNLIDGDEILIVNNFDCNFEIFLAQKLHDMEKKVKITVIKDNLIETDKCKSIVKNIGFENIIEIIYISQIEDISKLGKKYQRIVLRENIGLFLNKDKLFILLKNLLNNESSFIYLKTLVFKNIDTENKYMIEKQLKIIDFWNYNFSSTQDIINQLINSGLSVKYKDINVLLLSIFYNPQDIINIIKLYFVDLDLGFSNLIDWLAIYTLKLLHIKAYKDV